MMELFQDLSQGCSRLTTEKYSTSFSSAIKLLHKEIQSHIYNIYGFVRLADEIVDSFLDFNREALLSDFKNGTYLAIEQKISTNPILNSFQFTVNTFGIDHTLIEAFFQSMESDLSKQHYNTREYNEYIYGSAEVVGLMCLYVFCEGDKTCYAKLKPAAQALGAAFQKVNFLRDMRADFHQLRRTYFPGADFNNFTREMKAEIEADIDADFQKAYEGILMLPAKAKFGVFLAYNYYLSLFKKIKRTNPSALTLNRVRIPNYLKICILLSTGLKNRLNIL